MDEEEKSPRSEMFVKRRTREAQHLRHGEERLSRDKDGPAVQMATSEARMMRAAHSLPPPVHTPDLDFFSAVLLASFLVHPPADTVLSLMTFLTPS